MVADAWRYSLDLHPDDPFWIDDRGVLTRGALGEAVAAHLRELQNEDRGRRVVLEAVPTRESVVTLLGTLAAGRSAVLLPLREPEVRRRELAAAAAVDDSYPGQIWVRTSGTGGRARWVVHLPQTLMAGAEAAATRVGFSRGSAWRVSLPLDHVGGLSLVWRALVSGGALLAHDDAELETHRSLVPTQLYRLLSSGDMGNLKSLRCLLLGGAPIPCWLRHMALDAGLPLVVSYGLTETGALVAASLPNDPLLTEENYAGRALWRDRLAVADNGVVQVCGASLAVGQVDDGGKVAPLEIDTEGWHATGDLGHLDGDALFVTGRLDNVIISGGEKLPAEELEAALLALPGVLDAVVVPVDDSEFGQRPVAFLATARGVVWSRNDVRDALMGDVAPWKLPDRVWAMPEQHGLKMDRPALQDLAATRCRRDPGH